MNSFEHACNGQVMPRRARAGFHLAQSTVMFAPRALIVRTSVRRLP
jgi:hypothetical protein